MYMNRFFFIIIAGVMFAACNSSEEQLRRRAAELCKYIPDHELLEQSKEYLTEDFYTALDTMFNHLPEHEAMDHEWLYYFVTGNGGTIADYEVMSVELSDPSHAVATISVRQKWEDGSFDETNDVEEHRLYMEKVNGIWLMSDFDEHKKDCIRHVAISRREQAVRDAMSDYLVKEIGTHYLQGERCIPALMIVASEDIDSVETRIWGDFWVYWYKQAGDTLKTVSGGNHSGCMTLVRQGSVLRVTSFEQTVDGAGNDTSARRIFGQHYDVYKNMHSSQEVREAVRREQLQEYIRRYALAVSCYQDYGRDAVEL